MSLQSRKNSQLLIVLFGCKMCDAGTWVHWRAPTLPHQAGQEHKSSQVLYRVQAVPAHEDRSSRQQALYQQQPRCVCITYVGRSQNNHTRWMFCVTHTCQEVQSDVFWHTGCLRWRQLHRSVLRDVHYVTGTRCIRWRGREGNAESFTFISIHPC